jgi:hypothetical protein
MRAMLRLLLAGAFLCLFAGCGKDGPNPGPAGPAPTGKPTGVSSKPPTPPPPPGK